MILLVLKWFAVLAVISSKLKNYVFRENLIKSKQFHNPAKKKNILTLKSRINIMTCSNKEICNFDRDEACYHLNCKLCLIQGNLKSNDLFDHS